MYKKWLASMMLMALFLCSCAPAPEVAPTAPVESEIEDDKVLEQEPPVLEPEKPESAAPESSPEVSGREPYQDIPPKFSVSETGATVIDVYTDHIVTTNKYDNIERIFVQTSYENAVLLKKVLEHYEDEVVFVRSSATEGFEYLTDYNNGTEHRAGVWVV